MIRCSQYEISQSMRVLSYKAIREFIATHPTAAPALKHWYKLTRQATWQNLADTRRDFPHADPVGRRTVFNIAGNNFRMITRINYATQKVYVIHVLTHAEYDEGKWK